MRYNDFPPMIMISIHAPREGGDFAAMSVDNDFCISIHAPREGGDNTTGKTQ